MASFLLFNAIKKAQGTLNSKRGEAMNNSFMLSKVFKNKGIFRFNKADSNTLMTEDRYGFYIDLIGSLFGILLFSPFFIIIPILIKLTSKGPVFFRQERSGKGGKTFSFLKFRSMYVNNDATIHKEFITDFIKGNIKQTANGQKPVFKIKNDPRITPIGRILRKTSLDEIPLLCL
jgi:Sugar transferases involved in lipopolysaccharide synthesis